MPRLTLSLVILLAAVPGASLLAQSVPSGPEFQVNTFSTYYAQSHPAVATDGAGLFVVVWRGEGQDGDLSGIFGQRLDGLGVPVGFEFQVNVTTTDDQEQPDVFMDPNGAFTVVWTDFTLDAGTSGIFGRRFDSAGQPLGGEFQVNTYTTGVQDSPAIAGAPSGEFVVIWESVGQDGDGRGIFARRFDNSGAMTGSEFQVNLNPATGQFGADVAFDSSGGFVIAWGTDSYGVYGQRFDSTGSRTGSEFLASTSTSSYPHLASVDIAPGGEFLVAWEADGLDGDSFGIFARAFESGGSAVGLEFQVNSYTTSVQAAPEVVAVATGEFVVSWDSYGQDRSSWTVVGRSLDLTGNAIGSEVVLNSFTNGSQLFRKITTDGQGEGLAVWSDGSTSDIVGRRFCGDGDLDAVCDADDVFITSPVEMGSLDCSDPATIRPTFTWDPGNYEKFKLFMGYSPGFEKGTRVTSGDRAIKTTTWQPSKKKWKKACRKAVLGNPMNPVLFIRLFGKDIDLRKKDPARKTFSQTVQVDVTL